MIKCEKQSSSNNVVANNHVFLLKKDANVQKFGIDCIFVNYFESQRLHLFDKKYTKKAIFWKII